MKSYEIKFLTLLKIITLVTFFNILGAKLEIWGKE